MTDDEKIILEGVLVEFQKENNGRIYDDKVFKKHLEYEYKKIKQELRKKKLKNILR